MTVIWGGAARTQARPLGLTLGGPPKCNGGHQPRPWPFLYPLYLSLLSNQCGILNITISFCKQDYASILFPTDPFEMVQDHGKPVWHKSHVVDITKSWSARNEWSNIVSNQVDTFSCSTTSTNPTAMWKTHFKNEKNMLDNIMHDEPLYLNSLRKQDSRAIWDKTETTLAAAGT